MTDLSFPPPWRVVERDACFVVEDDNGQALGYFYFRLEFQAGILLKDEAQHMALNFARLPELLGNLKSS
jgi:hypothetical protein